MTSDLAKLMKTISMLQSEPTPTPAIESSKPVVHPLVQAMRELREDGTVDSVDANTIYRTVQSAHHTPEDFEEGDIGDRIYWFDDYKLTSLPVANLNLNEYYVDEDLVDDYVEQIQHSPNTMPPIVYDPIAKSIIDGIHRAAAYSKLGHATIPAYSGLTKSESYGEREEIDETVEEPIIEASPDTLEGSFTPDLVESKEWLCEKLAKGLKGKNAGTIYVLGSWYGNMGIFLQQAGVKFDKLVLVEPDEEALMRSKKLLEPLNDDGKLILLHQNAEDVVFDKPGIIINTSCNETGPVFLTKVPKGMLCALQARNNFDDVLISTDDLQEFDELFPLEKTYYTGEKELIDTEIDYTRFMKIGRAGNALSETASTGQGGGSAGIGGAQMVGGPTTYEQEYGMFKSKGPHRITAMTNEALDSSYEYDKGTLDNIYYFATEDNILYKVIFAGTNLVEVVFYPELEDEEGVTKPKTELTGTGNSRKVFGTVVKIVQEYVASYKPKALYFTADSSEPSRVKLYNRMISQADKALPDYYASKPLDLGSGTAYMLKKKEKQ
jgi:hypothetical protein